LLGAALAVIVSPLADVTQLDTDEETPDA